MAVLMLFALAVLTFATDQSWKKHVSESERARKNPYAGNAEAVAAGARLFADHCSKCHGDDALGDRKHPSLRTEDVQSASDGELFYILRNGYLRRGMPSWSSLPDATRWQLVTFVKSLGVSSEDHANNTRKAAQSQ